MSKTIGYLFIQEILVLMKLSVHPFLHVSGCEMAHWLARSPRHILSVFTWCWASMLWSIDSCQKRVSADECLMTVLQGHVNNSFRWHFYVAKYHLGKVKMWANAASGLPHLQHVTFGVASRGFTGFQGSLLYTCSVISWSLRIKRFASANQRVSADQCLMTVLQGHVNKSFRWHFF